MLFRGAKLQFYVQISKYHLTKWQIEQVFCGLAIHYYIYGGRDEDVSAFLCVKNMENVNYNPFIITTFAPNNINIG